MTIHRESKDEVWSKASEFFLDWLRRSIKRKTMVLLSGGSAVKLYNKLEEFIKTATIYPNTVAFAQVDERFRPRQKAKGKRQNSGIYYNNINADLIEQTGLWKICQAKRVPYFTISQQGTLDTAAEKYNNTISKLFKEYHFKAAVLGIGADGHTAGLLPGYEQAWNINKLVVGYKNDGEYKQRITITPKAIKQLDYALVVTVGEEKREAIANTLNKKNINRMNNFPAAVINQIKKVDLFTTEHMIY